MDKQICEHCGSELTKASAERKEISQTQTDNISEVKVALDERQLKLDEASQTLLDMVARIEEKVGADEASKEAIKLLELRIRAKILVEAENGKIETK